MSFNKILKKCSYIVWVQEVPKLLPIPLSTLYNWRYQGKYPEIFSKPGKKLMVDVKALLEIMKNEGKAKACKTKRPKS